MEMISFAHENGLAVTQKWSVEPDMEGGRPQRRAICCETGAVLVSGFVSKISF
jgi:hypothetical protein